VVADSPREGYSMAIGQPEEDDEMEPEKLLKLQLEINGVPLSAIIDTGSQMNLIRTNLARRVLRLLIDLTKPITMKDVNGGTGILTGFLRKVRLTCGTVDTYCNLHVGNNLAFDLLLGRKWQKENYVSIVERQDGTYLEFRDRRTDNTKQEVLVSPVDEEELGLTEQQAYSLTVQSSVKSEFQKAKSTIEINDTPLDAERRALHNLLGITILTAQQMDIQLHPPPPISTYSAMNKMGARMFFKILDQHCDKWNLFNYRKWKGTIPVEEASNIDLISFLVGHEMDALGDQVKEETFIDEALDLPQFLDIALEDACFESPKFQPLPPPEIPSKYYDNARIFHHYFSAYRNRLHNQQPISKIPNHKIVEFIKV
jgi:hypothetical protein